MGLSHLKPQVETVKTPDGDTFTVRGLGLNDIVPIVRAQTALAEMFQRYVTQAQAGALVVDDMAGFAMHLVEAAPAAVAHIISAAADEDDHTIAAKFILPVQIEALEKIGKLTFAVEGGAKKVVGDVLRMVGSAGALTSPQR